MLPAGHARVYCAFDVLIRLLQHLGYEVYYVRNFTDIDDKIIKRAAETGEEPLALSTRWPCLAIRVLARKPKKALHETA